MKSINHFLIITLICYASSYSQITKGNWMVGGTGNIGFYETKYMYNDQETANGGFGIGINPNLGIFLLNKIAVGAIVSFGYSDPKKYESTISFGVGPFARYYFLKEDKVFNLFAEAYCSFGKGISKVDVSTNSGYGFKAGPVIFFNSSVGLEIALDYRTTKLDPETVDSSKYKNVNLMLGFQIHLEK